MARDRKAKLESTPERFVEVWEESNSKEEVASKLGASVQAIDQRVRVYRKLGVELKKMPNARAVDVKALNDLVREVRARQNYGDDGK